MKRDIFIVIDKTSVPKEADSYRRRKNFWDVIGAISYGFRHLNSDVDYSVTLLSFSDKYSPELNIHGRFQSASDESDFSAVVNAEKGDMLVPWCPVRACINMGLSEYRKCLLKKVRVIPPVMVFVSGGDFCNSSHEALFSEKWNSLAQELTTYEKTGMLESRVVAISTNERPCKREYINSLSVKGENIISVNLDSERTEIINSMKQIFRQEI